MFTVGADPEIFVKKGGKGISVSETSLPGDKKTPFKTDYGAVQRDGFAAEFNINPTDLNDFEGFNQNIVRTIADLRSLAGDNINLAKGVTVMEFDPEYMAAQPEEVRELGCDPDFSAYTGEANPRPDGDRPFRTAAGHVHIGWGADIPVDNVEHIGICASFVKMLDATVGMYMTIIDREPRRRELYGKAGAFRPKPYGVEYRTPSNVWIWNRDRRLVFHFLVKLAINKMTAGYTPEGWLKLSEKEIQEIINTGNYEVAKKLVGYSMMPGGGEIGTAYRNVLKEIEKEFPNG